MAQPEVHESVKRSWWDGTVTMACGQVFKAGHTDPVIFVRVTCPGCLAAKAKQRKKSGWW